MTRFEKITQKLREIYHLTSSGRTMMSDIRFIIELETEDYIQFSKYADEFFSQWAMIPVMITTSRLAVHEEMRFILPPNIHLTVKRIKK